MTDTDGPGDSARPGFSPHLHTSRTRRFYHALLDSRLAQASAALLAAALPEPHVGLSSVDVTVPGLPSGLTGMRILHVSDFHLRPGSELAREVPDLVAGLDPDYTFYTGDFIDGDEGIEPVAELVSRLPRGRNGTYAILGNHDYMPLGRTTGANDVGRLCRALADVGVTVLRNESAPLCNGELFVVGVDDPATRRDDFARAASGVPAGVCSILLAHSPDIVLRLDEPRPGLILCGHTHGGQIRLPLVGPLLTMSRLPRVMTMGLHSFHGMPIYVTRGIGYSGLDIRLSCPAEVALLTLRSPLATEQAA